MRRRELDRMHKPGSGSGGCADPSTGGTDGWIMYNSATRQMTACAGSEWQAMGPEPSGPFLSWLFRLFREQARHPTRRERSRKGKAERGAGAFGGEDVSVYQRRDDAPRLPLAGADDAGNIAAR